MPDAFDTFTDADNTLLQDHVADTGQTWAKGSSSATNAKITSNAVISSSNSVVGIYTNSFVPTTADYSVTITLHALATFTQPATVCARMNAAGNTRYEFYLYTDGNVYLTKWVSGSGTDLASAAYSFSADADFTIEVIGTTINGYVDGVLKCTAVDSGISAKGSPGLFTQSTNVAITYWSVTNAAGPIPTSITEPTVATTGVTATGTLNPNGASISATDFTKVILGGQATACSAITALTVGNSTSPGVAYTLTLSGLVVPGITFTVNFTDGAFTNSGGVNLATGVLSGTNNSTTIDLIVDSGTLSGSTATINFDPVNVPANMWGGSVTLSNNNVSVGTFTTGSEASPVIGGDLITLNGYLSDGTLIASGTLFTVTSLTKLLSNSITAVLSGSLTMTPPANSFSNSTWRDLTESVNSTTFTSQAGSTGTWAITTGFTNGDAWGFSVVPTYVMNMTGTIIGTPQPFAVRQFTGDANLILGIL